jgi:DNA-binding HxlR family transcriptional regulator
LTASGANGNGSPARSGTRALGLLAKPLNGAIIRNLAEGPTRLVDLRRECGSPAQTTLRAHLRELERFGAVAKLRRNNVPGTLEYELTAPGSELLFLVDALERWLGEAPQGALTFGTSEAKAAIKSLIQGWSSTMLRALAAGPLSLTELDGIIVGLSYPSLERRLSTMRIAHQIEVCPGKGKGTPYAVTKWARQGIAPLAAGAQWERRNIPEDSSPVTRIDTEAAFLLTLPLLRLSPELSGSCRLGVEVGNGEARRLAGAMAYVEQGKVTSCTVRLERKANAWATGSATGWLQAVVHSDLERLELGGDQQLAHSLVSGLHGMLFGLTLQKRSEKMK